MDAKDETSLSDCATQASGHLDANMSPKSSLHDVEKDMNDGEQTQDSLDDGNSATLPTKTEAPEMTSHETPAPSDPAHSPSSFPDGGTQAWLVVGGAFCSLFVSFGWINCIGVFQSFYQTHQLRDMSPSTVAWITSLETFVMYAGGSWVGRVYDNYGPRILLATGTFFHVFGLMMASISTEYYQFILSQGICSALGASMIFYPSMNCVNTWFFKKRSLAFGIAASGASLGGVIFPILVDRLVNHIGFPWTMRICAFLILALMVISNLLVKARFPPTPRPVRFKDFIEPLGERKFFTLSLGMFFFYLGLFIPFTFIILEGQSRGVPDTLATYLVSILNSASIFGRIYPAYLADHYGRFTIFFTFSLFTSIITLALWLPSRGTAAVTVYAVIFGFSSGCAVSLPPTLVASLSDVRQIGVRTGTLFSLVAIAVLIGSPIAGALVTADNGGFAKLQILSGVTMLVGTVLFGMLRVQIGGWSWRAKV